MRSVLVLDSHSKQGLVAIRSLGSHGMDVTAASPRRWSAGRFSKHVDRYVRYPFPDDDPEAFARAIEDELVRGEYDMLLPVQEVTAQTIVKRKSRFEEYTSVPFPSYEKLQVGLDKRKTIEAAREFDVPRPKTMFSDETSIETVEEVLGYPVVVKPVRGSGRDDVSVCDSRETLERAVQETQTEDEAVLCQEFIPNGGECGVYTLYNWGGELTALTVQRRLRSNPPEGGASTYRETVDDPSLVALTDDFLTALDWQGVAMVEFRIDSRTGEPKLMEINPRLWGSLALSVSAGVDFPYLLYRLSVEDEITPDLRYDIGVCAHCIFTDFLQVLHREDKPRAVREFLATLSKPCHHDIVSIHDPLPTVGQIAYWLDVLIDDLRNDSPTIDEYISEALPEDTLDR